VADEYNRFRDGPAPDGLKDPVNGLFLPLDVTNAPERNRPPIGSQARTAETDDSASINLEVPGPAVPAAPVFILLLSADDSLPTLSLFLELRSPPWLFVDVDVFTVPSCSASLTSISSSSRPV
jgi:hypothetical protein